MNALLSCTCVFRGSGEVFQLAWLELTKPNISSGTGAESSILCLPLVCAGAAVSEAAGCTPHHLMCVFVQDKFVPGPRTVVPTQRAAVLCCSAVQMNLPYALGSDNAVAWLHFACLHLWCLLDSYRADRARRKRFVLDCFFCWGVLFFFFNWLDSQQCWMRCKISREGSVVLRGDGNGKEWESPCVRGSLNLGCAAGTALERQQGREEAVPGAVPLAEKMHFELVSLQGTSSAW